MATSHSVASLESLKGVFVSIEFLKLSTETVSSPVAMDAGMDLD